MVPKRTKFQNWQHPKLKIFKIWIDTWIPFIFLIKKHPWLQFCVWIWWNCRLLLFTTSEAQRYPWAQNIKISFYQAYFHAKILLTRGGAVENLTTLVTITVGYWINSFAKVGKFAIHFDTFQNLTSNFNKIDSKSEDKSITK